jgi:hypothetical protein
LKYDIIFLTLQKYFQDFISPVFNHTSMSKIYQNEIRLI